MSKEIKAQKEDNYTYIIPKSFDEEMLVEGIVYANEKIFSNAKQDNALGQVVNVAKLKGIVKASYAMPDIHLGYGFAIGGVAAFDADDGVISPGGVGFDINCGVRLLRTNLEAKKIASKVEELMYELSRNIPKGIGRQGAIRLSKNELAQALKEGVSWAVSKGYGEEEDIYNCEETGKMIAADPECVSRRALERGSTQLGSLGSGNHFIEVQKVEEIFDERAATIFGLFKGQAVAMIHSGSRGLGHQVATDYVKKMQAAGEKYGLVIPDRQLASAPANSKEAGKYFGAMACAMNFAWINRHVIAHFTRKAFETVLNKKKEDIGLELVYDVAHNSAKLEDHVVNGKEKRLYIHRKGATRAFAPKSKEIPEKYKETGQPVFIPGDMGRNSFVLAGTQKAMELSFGSTCHGAGRLMSRSKAKRTLRGIEVKRELESKGITVVAGHLPSLAEEAPQAYKNVNEVVEICHEKGISKKIAKLKPMGVIKG